MIQDQIDRFPSRVRGESCAPRSGKQGLGLMPLAHLPNRDGFTFIAVCRDGSCVECAVAKDPLTGLHRVTGAVYANLIGWKQK